MGYATDNLKFKYYSEIWRPIGYVQLMIYNDVLAVWRNNVYCWDWSYFTVNIKFDSSYLAVST